MSHNLTTESIQSVVQYGKYTILEGRYVMRKNKKILKLPRYWKKAFLLYLEEKKFYVLFTDRFERINLSGIFKGKITKTPVFTNLLQIGNIGGCFHYPTVFGTSLTYRFKKNYKKGYFGRKIGKIDGYMLRYLTIARKYTLLVYSAKTYKLISVRELQHPYQQHGLRLSVSKLAKKKYIMKCENECGHIIKINISEKIDQECNICMDANLEVAIIPCGHKLCNDCFNAVTECPECRARILAKIPLDITNGIFTNDIKNGLLTIGDYGCYHYKQA
jgi:hypothetical protein